MAIEEKHKQSETRFRTVFEQSFLGNKIISSDLRIRQINSALVTLLGYNKEDLLGKSVVNYTHPDFREKWDILRHNLWDKKIPSFQVKICYLLQNGLSSFMKVIFGSKVSRIKALPFILSCL